MEQAVILPGRVRQVASLLRGKNADERLRQRGLRPVRLPGHGRRSSSQSSVHSDRQSVRQVKAQVRRPAGDSPGRPPEPSIVVTYIIRRLIGAVAACCSSSASSRSRSSSWCPGWPGATPETLAARYVGRDRRRRDRRATAADGSASTTRSPCSTGAGSRASSSAPDYDYGPSGRALPGAVLRLLVHQPAAGLARPARPAAGDALAGHRRGRHLAGLRRRAPA